MQADDRYDRQRRISGWNQQALANACVMVAGTGAIGNELLKNLVLLGVGRILAVDFDYIEASNLSRAVLFSDDDVGRPKAQVAAERARQLNPAVDLRYITGDLFYDVGLGFYRHCDLAVSGLDNLAARSRAGVSCAMAGIPFLDGGMWALGGEVRWLVGGEYPCFDCTMTADDRRRAFDRRSCTGFQDIAGDPFERQVPTTISSAAIIGGLLAQETVRYLCGWEIAAGEALVYNGLLWRMHRTTLNRNPDCPYHQPYQAVQSLPTTAAKTTPRQILQQIQPGSDDPPWLLLGRDFLHHFYCRHCDATEPVHTHLSKVDEANAACPRCGRRRHAEILTQLTADSPYAGSPLAALGVPPGEVLAVQVDNTLQLFELSGDITAFWNTHSPLSLKGEVGGG